MKQLYQSFLPGEEIPVLPLLKKRKLFKYYTRETMAAVLTAGRLLQEAGTPPDLPFYYASAEMEDETEFRAFFQRFKAGEPIPEFSPQRYYTAASPLFLFKMMRNMVPCFVSIENGLVGDNNVLLDSAEGLLLAGMTAPARLVLLGAGYLHADGTVETGFALMSPDECAARLSRIHPDDRAIELFRC